MTPMTSMTSMSHEARRRAATGVIGREGELARLNDRRLRAQPSESVLDMGRAVSATSRHWELHLHNGCRACLVEPQDDRGAARVHIEHIEPGHPHGVQLVWGNLTFDTGRRYTVSMWARAARPRPATVQVSQNHEPWERIGPCHEIQLDEQWRPVSFDFEPIDEEVNARIHLDLGDDDADVEVSFAAVGSPLFRLFELDVHDGSIASVTPAPGEKDAVRVEFSSLDERAWESVQLTMGRFQLKSDKVHSVSLRARSDAHREIAVVVGQDCEPWETAGIYQRLALSPQWASYFYTFQTTHSGPGRLYFDLGNDDAAVEIADVVLCKAENHVNDMFERNGAACLIEFPPEHPGVLRVLIATGEKREPQDVQIFIAERSIEKGRRYYATFEARSDRPRDLGFGCVKGKTDWTGVGLYYRVGVGTAWKPYYYEFVAEETADGIRVLFDLGESDIPVELRNVRFAEGVSDMASADLTRLEHAVEALRDAMMAESARG